jgi:hypothetical protein
MDYKKAHHMVDDHQLQEKCTAGVVPSTLTLAGVWSHNSAGTTRLTSSRRETSDLAACRSSRIMYDTFNKLHNDNNISKQHPNDTNVYACEPM